MKGHSTQSNVDLDRDMVMIMAGTSVPLETPNILSRNPSCIVSCSCVTVYRPNCSTPLEGQYREHTSCRVCVHMCTCVCVCANVCMYVHMCVYVWYEIIHWYVYNALMN